MSALVLVLDSAIAESECALETESCKTDVSWSPKVAPVCADALETSDSVAVGVASVVETAGGVGAGYATQTRNDVISVPHHIHSNSAQTA